MTYVEWEVCYMIGTDRSGASWCSKVLRAQPVSRASRLFEIRRTSTMCDFYVRFHMLFRLLNDWLSMTWR